MFSELDVVRKIAWAVSEEFASEVTQDSDGEAVVTQVEVDEEGGDDEGDSGMLLKEAVEMGVEII